MTAACYRQMSNDKEFDKYLNQKVAAGELTEEDKELLKKAADGFVVQQQEEKERRQRAIGEFDDLIAQINNAESRSKQAELAFTITLYMQLIEEYCLFLSCRYDEFVQRARRGEVGANAVLYAIQEFGEETFWKKAAYFRMLQKTFDAAFPDFKDNEKMRRDFQNIPAKEQEIITETQKQLDQQFSEEIDREYKKWTTEERKKKAKEARRDALDGMGVVFLGILLSILFAATAFAHWSLHNGWEGPQNVFLEVVFPFLMVIGSIYFAAQAFAVLMLLKDPEIMWLGYGIGGAIAIAFLVFWKHRVVCIGAQIVIAGLLLTFLIIMFVKFIRFLKHLKS